MKIKKMIFALKFLCLLGGCSSTEPAIKVEVQSDENTPLPVRIDTKRGEALPVNLNTQADEGLPVEIKLPLIVLVSGAITGLAVLVIAIVICIATISTARSTKAACNSIEAIRKSQKKNPNE